MKKTNVDVNDNRNRITDIIEGGVDWKTRTVWIVGELPDEKSYRYIPLIRMLDETPGPITVMILSQGGGEGGGFALYDTLRSLRNHVTTVGCGMVYSIAVLIFQAGDTRILYPNAEMMVHNGTVHMEVGDVDTDLIQQIATETARNNKRYHNALAQRVGCGIEVVAGWCQEETYFTAEEALKVNLTDTIQSDHLGHQILYRKKAKKNG